MILKCMTCRWYSDSFCHWRPLTVAKQPHDYCSQFDPVMDKPCTKCGSTRGRIVIDPESSSVNADIRYYLCENCGNCDTYGDGVLG